MTRHLLIAFTLAAALCSCGRPSAGDFAMPQMTELAATVGDGSVELRCALSSSEGITEAGAYLSDGSVETRNKGLVKDGAIVVTVDGVKSGKEYSYRFFISNGTYEKVSISGTFRTEGMTDYVEFEDDAFQQYCLKNFDSDSDGRLSAYEVESVKIIDCSGLSIQSLSGLESFTNLRDLNCRGNRLTALDVSGNEFLSGLNCEENNIKSLDLSRNTFLRYIDCHSNMLTSLDLSANASLTGVYCYDNHISTLDVSKCTILTTLGCSSNNITAIDVRNCSVLTELSVSDNRITELDVSGNPALTSLDCGSNLLRSLDVSHNTQLKTLSVSSNYLTSLDISSLEHLEEISVESNKDMKALSPAHPELVKRLSIGDTGIDKWDFTDMPLLEHLSANSTPMPCLPVFASDEKILSLHLSGDVSSKFITEADYFRKYPNVVDINCSCTRMKSADFTGNSKLENVWIASADNLITIDLGGSPNLRCVYIDYDRKLETVYVHPDVDIDAIETTSNECHAEFRHKQ